MTSFSAHRTFRNVILRRESLRKASSIHFCSLIAPMMARKDFPENLFIELGLPGFFVFDRVVKQMHLRQTKIFSSFGTPGRK